MYMLVFKNCFSSYLQAIIGLGKGPRSIGYIFWGSTCEDTTSKEFDAWSIKVLSNGMVGPVIIKARKKEKIVEFISRIFFLSINDF